MEQAIRARAPLHLWLVGILSLLWNAFGAYDYFMTRTQGAKYIDSMMPGGHGLAMMDYINAFPLWASIGWGLGVWCGLLGSILLLARSEWAVPAFTLSAAGAIIGIGYQLAYPAQIAAMHDGINGAMPYVIILVAIFLMLYARGQKASGILS